MTRAPATFERAPRLGDPDRPGYEACTGCGICTLPCPVWHQTHDVTLTLHGRAKALQRGASVDELAESLVTCVLCGACEPACPEGIDTVGMTIDLRVMFAQQGDSPLAALAAREGESEPPGEPLLLMRGSAGASPSPDERLGGSLALPATRFLPGRSVRANEKYCQEIVAVLEQRGNLTLSPDDGSDIATAIEAGLPVTPSRQERFVQSLAGARELIVADGILHRFLRRCLSRARVRVVGLGEALLRLPAIRKALRPTDLYVIEPRGYHADFARLVRVYDELRKQIGCEMNLDLQRIAIPTGASSLQARTGLEAVDSRQQARWILEGRKVERVVVESLADREPFAQVTRLPVVHLCELAAVEAPA